MSYVRLSYLYCDGNSNERPLAGAAFDCAPGVGETIAEQRERAKVHGWLVGQPHGRDYCDECRKKITVLL